MKIPNRLAACGAAIALSVLAACGGSGSTGSLTGSSSSASSTTTSGSSSSITASSTSTANGVLTAFGSVFVNGTEYQVDHSTSVVDGDSDDVASSASALLVGMTLDVSAQSGTATFLRYRSAVRGEVDAIDTTQSTLTVLGQTVVVSSGTSFAGSKTSSGTTTSITSLGNVSVGDYVVVYGYQDCTSSTSTSSCTAGSTQVLATLVYEPTTVGAYGTAGFAESVDTTSGSFMINGLTVDYTTSGTSATTCDPSPCSFTDGDFVQVRSSTAPTATSSALTLAATRIKTSSYAPVLVTGETASIEGAVNGLNTTTDAFTVRGVSIDGSALASTVAALSDGEIVRVTGTVNSSGGLAATAITVLRHATFTLTAPVTALDGTADTIVVFGQTFTVNSATLFFDRAQDVRPFNLSNFATVLSAGDQLEVSGYSTSSGLIATRVVRLPTPTTAYVEAQGIVTADSATDDTLTIGGITVTLSSSTSLRYPGSGSSASLTGFFNAVTVGTTVATVKGTAGTTASTMAATSASLFGSGCDWASGGF